MFGCHFDFWQPPRRQVWDEFHKEVRDHLIEAGSKDEQRKRSHNKERNKAYKKKKRAERAGFALFHEEEKATGEIFKAEPPERPASDSFVAALHETFHEVNKRSEVVRKWRFTLKEEQRASYISRALSLRSKAAIVDTAKTGIPTEVKNHPSSSSS